MNTILYSFSPLQLTVSYSCHRVPSFFRFHSDNTNIVVDVYLYRYYITTICTKNYTKLFFFSLISLIADGPHQYHPACGHKGSSHLSPAHALQFFIAMQVQHSYNSSTDGGILLTHVPTLSVTKERTQILLW